MLNFYPASCSLFCNFGWIQFTGIAIYASKKARHDIVLKQSAAISAGLMEGSKGAACAVVKIHGTTTICFISSHLSSNTVEDKLGHYKTIVKNAGIQGFDLCEQFHHIVWFGDLNYKITKIKADDVMLHIAMGQNEKVWQADSLRHEMTNGRVFYNFNEPIPRKDFYPTFKKKENRQFDFARNPDDLKQASLSAQETCLSLLDKVYQTKYKEPLYKLTGGAAQDVIPSFCDRILYRSLQSTSGQLTPEFDNGILNYQQGVSYNGCHNYGCIPHNLMGSDHSAVYCGLTLKSSSLIPYPSMMNNLSNLDFDGNSVDLRIHIKNVVIKAKGKYKFSSYEKSRKTQEKKDNDNDITPNVSQNVAIEPENIPDKMKFLFPAPFEIDHVHDHKQKTKTSIKKSLYRRELVQYLSLSQQMASETHKRIHPPITNSPNDNKDTAQGANTIAKQRIRSSSDIGLIKNKVFEVCISALILRHQPHEQYKIYC